MENENIVNVQPEDTLEIEKVDYKKLDKIDLARLCKEKDTAIASYEAERKSKQDRFNKEIEDMNAYYVARINELKSLVKYYERKFKLIKDLINIEKGDETHDTVQRTTNKQA